MYIQQTGTFLSSKRVQTKKGDIYFAKVMIDGYDEIAEVYAGKDEPELMRDDLVQLNIKLDFANSKLGIYFAN